MNWQACSLEPNLILRWIECHPAVGGYLTLGAIIAALWASFVEIRQTKARSVVLAYRLNLIVAEITTSAAAIQTLLAHIRVNQNAAMAVREFFPRLAITTQIPEPLLAECWTLPNHVALAVAQLDSCLKTNVRYVADLVNAGNGGRGGAVLELLAILAKNTNSTESLAQTVRQHCARITDRTVRRYRWRRNIKRLLGSD